jgi:hypothetical protein
LLPLLALTALACESPLAPGTVGPPVFAAEIDHHPWPPADSPAVFTATLADSGTLTIAAAIRDASGAPVELLGMSIPRFQGARRYPLSASPRRRGRCCGAGASPAPRSTFPAAALTTSFTSPRSTLSRM